MIYKFYQNVGACLLKYGMHRCEKHWIIQPGNSMVTPVTWGIGPTLNAIYSTDHFFTVVALYPALTQHTKIISEICNKKKSWFLTLYFSDIHKILHFLLCRIQISVIIILYWVRCGYNATTVKKLMSEIYRATIHVHVQCSFPSLQRRNVEWKKRLLIALFSAASRHYKATLIQH